MKLLVGLGNPGREYAETRHNIGFLCLNHLAKRLGTAFSRRQAKARVATAWADGEEIVLAKPQTFVNRSGDSVAELVRLYQIPPPDLLIVHDDMDLPLGTIRLRPRGSAGGHNGMKSVIAALGSQDFPRLRVGIGRPGEGDAVEHVLGGFSTEEERLLSAIVERASDAALCFIREGIAAAMDKYNAPPRNSGSPNSE